MTAHATTASPATRRPTLNDIRDEAVRHHLERVAGARILLERDRYAEIEWAERGLTLDQRDAAAERLARRGEARLECCAGRVVLVAEARP